MPHLPISFLLASALLAGGNKGPELRIETGMHTAPINSIRADAAARFLATGGDDKTLRVWDIATGELLRTLRIPIGPGKEGVIKAVAMAPDGTMVAVSGWTGNVSQENGFSIYLFEIGTGRLTLRIGELPDSINQLAFSPDGTRLAVALGGSSGTRIFDSKSGAELSRDTEFAGDCPAIDYDAGGRLAAVAYDGSIRLYDPSGTLVNKAAAPGGENPNDIAFSPDSKKLAVSYSSTSRVDILSSSTLELISIANPGDQEDTVIRKIAWSSSGAKLFAAAKRGTDRIWGISPLPLRGPLLHPLQGSITDLQALPGGRFALGSDKPSWAISAEDGRAGHVLVARTADFSGNASNLLVDDNAHNVRFACRFSGTPSSAYITIRERLIFDGVAQAEALEGPSATVPGLRVTNWNGSPDPAANRRPLWLDALDTSHSVDVSPDGTFLVLGTELSLRAFDKSARKLWSLDPPAPAWAVNISRDRRLVVAAFGDGTIRWFRADSGRELLAFFPHSDGKRWVAWTPSGYYDAAVGGEDLIGWHTNRGPDQAADFFPVSHFRQRFYRPGVVARVLDTLDEDQALADVEDQRQPNPPVAIPKLLPPVVTILAPAGNATFHDSSVPLRIAVRSPSGEPVTAVRALVDGRPAGSARGLVYEPQQQVAHSAIDQIYTFSVTVPPRDCTVAIIAETRLAISEPVPVKLRWGPRVTDSPAPLLAKPKLYLLSVGVGAYASAAFQLDLTAKDANDVAAAWKKQEGGLYREVEVRLLTDANATKNGILDGLEWLERQTTAADVAVLYFSGHGLNDPRSGEYLFLPYEADLEARRKTMLPSREVRSALSSIPGKVLLFLDTCHSGNLLGPAKSRDVADLTGLLNELTSAENGVVVFSASTGRQQAIESSEWKNGAFTGALLEALAGKADLDGDSSLFLTEIEAYLARRVKELTQGLQTPVAAKPGGMQDYPVALVRPK